MNSIKTAFLIVIIGAFSLHLIGQDKKTYIEPPHYYDDGATTYKRPEVIISKNEDGSYNEKTVSRKDDNNKEIFYEKYLWSRDKSYWIGIDKGEWKYDSNGNETLNSKYTWDSLTYKWVGQYKIDRIYDANNNLLMSASYVEDKETNEWIGQYNKTEYEYRHPKERFQTMIARYSWSKEKKDWEPASREETYYRGDGNFVFRIDYKGVNGEWIPSSKSDRFYNILNKPSLSQSYKWDDEMADWVNTYKGVYEYNSRGSIILSTRYYWIRTANKWIFTQKTKWIYDEEDKQIKRIEFNWDIGSNSWIEKSQD